MECHIALFQIVNAYRRTINASGPDLSHECCTVRGSSYRRNIGQRDGADHKTKPVRRGSMIYGMAISQPYPCSGFTRRLQCWGIKVDGIMALLMIQ